MVSVRPSAPRLPFGARLKFSLGDLAFNFYWQSVTLYLLFYYTDVIGVPIGTAAFIFMVGAVWDGIVDLVVGVAADRVRFRRAGYASYLKWASVPLGIAFALLYLRPPVTGAALGGALLTSHLIFRTLYATANVPYSALTARITTDARDRAWIAGLRMLFGTIAAVIVALSTQPLAKWAAASPPWGNGYLAPALVFALCGSAILILVARSVQERVPPREAMPAGASFTADCLRMVRANRAFVTLMVAMAAMIVAVTVLNKAVLYYFKYYIGDEAGGREALAIMAAVGAASVPVWMMVNRWIGARSIWLVAVGIALAGLAVFAATDIRDTRAMQAFLGVLQVATMGIHFAFWSLLPNTIEYGEHQTGLRMEATTFGIAALLQKLALGAAAGLFGVLFDAIGYRANVVQGAGTLVAMRWIVLAIPAGAFALSGLVMLANPLRRDTHARIVAALGKRG